MALPSPSLRPATWFAAVLADVGLANGNGSRLDTDSVAVLSRGRKPLIAGDLIGPSGTTRSRRAVVAKAYRDDRGAATLGLLNRLTDSGLGSGPFRVTTGLAWSGRYRSLVTERAPGAAWNEFMVDGDPALDIVSRAAGRWLQALQALPVTGPADGWLPDRSGYRAESDLAAQASVLGRLFPSYHSRLCTIADMALHDLAVPPQPTLVASHGDLHPENVHVVMNGTGVARVTALDLDTVGLRRASYDVGYAVAQLLVMSRIRGGSFVPGARAARAFRTAWHPSEPAGRDSDAVPAQVARALVQSIHFELVTLDNNRIDLLPQWCAIAETALAEGVPALLDGLARGGQP